MKKFKTSFYGYNKNEVNVFVSQVAKEYESMLTKLKQQDVELKTAQDKLIHYETLETTLNRTLVVAEETANQIKKLARDESKTIIDDAKKNASRIVSDALIKAQKVESDAEELKRKIVIFKKKFRMAVEAELESIESIDETL